MAVLVFSCFLIGLVPLLVVPVIALGISAWLPGLKDVGPHLIALAPLDWITVMGLALSTALIGAGALLWLQLRRSAVEKGSTWGCGYVAPTPRIQYTSSSFAEMLVRLFSWVLRRAVARPKSVAVPEKERLPKRCA